MGERMFLRRHAIHRRVANLCNPVNDEWRIVRGVVTAVGRHHEKLFLTTRGRFHSLSPLGLQFDDSDGEEKRWTSFFPDNLEDLNSLFSLFSALVGPVDAIVARRIVSCNGKLKLTPNLWTPFDRSTGI